MKRKNLYILLAVFVTCTMFSACNKNDSIESANIVEETISTVEAESVTEETETTTVEEKESTVEVIESTEEIETTTVEEVYSTEDENSILDGLSDEEMSELEKEAEALGTTPEALAEAKKLMEQWAAEDAQKNNTQIDVDVPGGTPASEATEQESNLGKGGELPDHLKGNFIGN